MVDNYNKHLTLDERKRIEDLVYQRKHKSEIAKDVNKSLSTISKEIKKHRKLRARNTYDISDCIYLKECKVCNYRCRDYEGPKCVERDRTIGACNGCSKLKTCKKDKYFYRAKEANEKYIYTLKDSREGVNLTSAELITMAHIIKPLIEKGQSIYQILESHKEIDICPKTLYTYIEMGLFKDWGITNLSLKRKVRRRIRNKTLKKRKEPANYEGRKYSDYLEFIKENPNVPTTEMDTVYNNQDGPYIQTFIFENTGLMIGILHGEKTSKSMASALDKFQDVLGDDYSKLFSLLLTDRGTEFITSELFEVNTNTGEIRSNIFYCDAQQPSQKPHVENNHNFIREILPNGQSWMNLTQDKVDLMFSHINSVPRKSLGGKTPYDAFSFFYDSKILDKLSIRKIERDEVTLKPYLLKIK